VRRGRSPTARSGGVPAPRGESFTPGWRTRRIVPRATTSCARSRAMGGSSGEDGRGLLAPEAPPVRGRRLPARGRHGGERGAVPRGRGARRDPAPGPAVDRRAGPGCRARGGGKAEVPGVGRRPPAPGSAFGGSGREVLAAAVGVDAPRQPVETGPRAGPSGPPAPTAARRGRRGSAAGAAGSARPTSACRGAARTRARRARRTTGR
jgi:hypothetical protein